MQLATLMNVTALPRMGVNAAKVLIGDFPSIVSNLQSIQNEAMKTQHATAAVHFNRSCTMLPVNPSAVNYCSESDEGTCCVDAEVGGSV
jgi:hypothetical protein